MQFFVISILIAVDCTWSEWSIGQCSKTCDQGTRTKTRSKLVVEKNGGSCTGESSVSENCKIVNCPGKID